MPLYTGYPLGSAVTGTEVFGPVRQAGQDVTIAASQIAPYVIGTLTGANVISVLGFTPVAATNASVVAALGYAPVSATAPYAITLAWNGAVLYNIINGVTQGSLVQSNPHTITLNWNNLVAQTTIDGIFQGSFVHSNNSHSLQLSWTGSELQVFVDGVSIGYVTRH